MLDIGAFALLSFGNMFAQIPELRRLGDCGVGVIGVIVIVVIVLLVLGKL